MTDQTSEVMEDNNAYNIPDDKIENSILIEVNVSFFLIDMYLL